MNEKIFLLALLLVSQSPICRVIIKTSNVFMGIREKSQSPICRVIIPIQFLEVVIIFSLNPLYVGS